MGWMDAHDVTKCFSIGILPVIGVVLIEPFAFAELSVDWEKFSEVLLQPSLAILSIDLDIVEPATEKFDELGSS